MAAISPVAASGSYLVLRNATAQADTGQTDWINVPGWAKGAIVYLNWTAKAGTTPLMDLNLLEADPVARDDGTVLNLADWDGITQLTTTCQCVVHVGPGITGLADDDTGSATADSVYKINSILPALLGAKITLDRTGKPEIQVITLTDEAGAPDPGDEFKVVCEGNTTAAFVIGTNCAATDIQTALRTASGDSGLAVSGTTDEGPFTVTWSTSEGNQAQMTTTGVSGMTSAVVTTTQQGGADETYTYTLAVKFKRY